MNKLSIEKQTAVISALIEGCSIRSTERMTRLTNAFSKKLENLKAAVALHFAHYNFVRIHQTLKTTPAIAAGVVEEKLTIKDLIEIGS